MYNIQDALGFVETRGLAAAIEVADAMAKTADVTIEAAHKVDAGLICVICSGDVASCKAAVDAGVTVAMRTGSLFASNVIARPAGEGDDMNILDPLAAINAKKAAKKAAKLAAKRAQSEAGQNETGQVSSEPARMQTEAVAVQTTVTPEKQTAPPPKAAPTAAPKAGSADAQKSEKPKKAKKK